MSTTCNGASTAESGTDKLNTATPSLDHRLSIDNEAVEREVCEKERAQPKYHLNSFMYATIADLCFHGVLQGLQQLVQKQGAGPARREALPGPQLCENAFDDVNNGAISWVVNHCNRSTEHLA